jgi:hypothetical protein
VEGFAQRQPSDFASSKPVYFNLNEQAWRSLANSKFSAKRQEYSVTVTNAFFAAINNEAQKDAFEAFEADHFKKTLGLFKHVSHNLGATSDMHGDK